MDAVSIIEGRAYPLGLDDVDTDVIIPAEWLKTVSRKGLGAGAFAVLRQGGGSVFDVPRFAGAPILIAGRNFGCGSSREHAVWAMRDIGIRAVIAPSFSDIFAGNAFRNGLLAVTLDESAVARLMEAARTASIRIDLPAQTVTTPLGDYFEFDFDAFRKQCLVNGADEISLTEMNSGKIADFEQKIKAIRPFLFDLGG
ncbi:MAG: 3-isopropylmalate dehydratase small subunit [Sphingosinicella sp.]|uniref:3-isopropylmalate dehydratase small subunit n=1 Tax=Sphingosinicella sp. TaxID=1917971 RepID=UPI00403761A1